MSRPVRLEFSGALYHVTARGDRREPIYEDDADREHFLKLLGDGITRFNWRCHAYQAVEKRRYFSVVTIFEPFF